MFNTVVTAARILGSKGDSRRALIKNNEIAVYRAAGLASYVFRWLPLRLEYIFTVNGTDKHSPNWHQYGPHYRHFFREFRWKRIKLLEIGIGGMPTSSAGVQSTHGVGIFHLRRSWPAISKTSRY